MNGRIPIRLLLSTGHSCYRPRRDGERPKNPYFFLQIRTHSMKNSNQILQGNQTRCEGKILRDKPRMLMYDLSAPNLVWLEIILQY